MSGMPRLNVCAVTRVIFPAYLMAIAVATLTGSDGIGLVAFALTAAAVVAVQRMRGTTVACGISAGPARTRDERFAAPLADSPEALARLAAPTTAEDAVGATTPAVDDPAPLARP